MKIKPKLLKTVEIRNHAQPALLQRIIKKIKLNFVFGTYGALLSFGRAVHFTESWESEGTTKPVPVL